jgi:hypothetical protein
MGRQASREPLNVVVRLDRLLGREVRTANHRRLGRVEEFRCERRGDDWVVTGYVIGAAGLSERLGLGVRLILGLTRSRGYLARWDQLDLSDPDHPRVTCPVDALQRL